jgi:transposase
MDTKIQPVISPTKRGPYRQHSDEFKRAVVAKSFVPGSSVARVARESGINANQLFTWRKQFGAMPSALTEGACQLLPVIALDSVAASSPADIAAASRATGAILLTVGPAQLRLEGAVDQAMLAQVLARLLP